MNRFFKLQIATWVLLASSTLPAKPASLAMAGDSMTVSVSSAGKHEFLLPIAKWGRYSLQATGDQPVELSIADRRNGVFRTDGIAGERNPRIDLFLDAGEYRLAVQGEKGVQGNSTLRATPFRPVAGFRPTRLVPRRENLLNLDDLEQVDFWFETPSDTTVYIEAVGRNLSELALWRDGQWLVKTANRPFVAYPKPETPLSGLCFQARLHKGTYRLSAYGGKGRDWALKAQEHPLALRMDLDSVSANSTTLWTIPSTGYARIALGSTVSTVVLEANDKKRLVAEIQSLTPEFPDEGSIAKDSISGKSAAARVALVVGRSGSENPQRVVTVFGAPGQKFALVAFGEPRTSIRDMPSGTYWLSTTHTGNPVDRIGATGLVVDQTSSTIRAIQADTLGLGREIARRFNLLEPVNSFLWVDRDGKYSVTVGGTACKWRIRRYFQGGAPGNYLAPEYTAESKIVDLTKGVHYMELLPVKKGVATLVLKDASTLANLVSAGKAALGAAVQANWTYGAPAVQFQKLVVDANDRLSISVNSQSPDLSVASLRQSPVDPDEPLSVWCRPGERIEIPVRLEGKRQVGFVDRTGNAVAMELDGKRVEGLALTESGNHVCAIKNDGAESRQFVLKSTPLERVPSVAAPAYDPSRLAAGRSPAITTGSVTYFDLDRKESRPYTIHVDQPGIHRIETTGRLATKIDLSDRFQQFTRSAESNGTGRNAMLIEYLLAGDYQVDVATTGKSAGRLGLSVARNALVEGGALDTNIDNRKFVEAFAGSEYSLRIPFSGRYRIESSGMNGNIPLRLEDADGWPMPALSEEPIDQNLSAGSYRLVALPVASSGRQIARLAPVLEKRTIKGKGPHALELNEPLNSVWVEQSGENGTEEPVVFELRIPSPLRTRLSVSNGFQARLVAAGKDSAQVRWSGTKSVELDTGSYRILVQPAKPRNHAPFRIAATTGELVPGLAYQIRKPRTFAVVLGRSSIVEIGSKGALDVQGTLLAEDGKTVIATNDDAYLDWNFSISRSLKAGRYFLRVESAQPGFTSTTVFLRALTDTVMDSLRAPGGASRSMACNLHRRLGIFPLDTREGGELLACAVRSKSRIGCALEKRDSATRQWISVAQTIGADPSLTVPRSKDARYRLKVWSESNLDEPLDVFLALPNAREISLKDAASGLSGSPEAFGRNYRAWYKLDLGTHAPGHFKASSTQNQLGAIGIGSGTDTAFAQDGGPWFSSIASRAWIEMRFEQEGRFQVQLTPFVLDKNRPIEVPLVGGAVRVFETDLRGGAIGFLSVATDGGRPVVGAVLSARDKSDRFALANASVRTTFQPVPNGSVSVALPTDEARVAVWNALAPADGSTISATLALDELPVVEGGTLGESTSRWPMEKSTARKIPMNRRGAGRLRILIPAGGAVLLERADGSTRMEASMTESVVKEFTVDGGSLYLLAPREAGVFEITQYALAGSVRDTNLARASNPFWTEKFLRDGVRFLPLANDRIRYLQSGGTVQNVNWIDARGTLHPDLRDGASVGPGGLLEIAYKEGWAKVNLCDANSLAEVMKCKWAEPLGDAWTKEFSQTSELPLNGRNDWFSFVVGEEPQQLRLTLPLPASAILLRDDAVVDQKESWDHFHWDLPLTAGRYKLGIRSMAGSNLTGIAMPALFRPLEVFTEKRPYRCTMTPGESRLVAFDVAKKDKFGIGLAMTRETVQSTLLDANGTVLEEGKQQFVSLKPGRHYLRLRVPEASEGTDLTVHLLGQEPPPNQPPEKLVKWIVEDGSGPRPQVVDTDEPAPDSDTPSWMRLVRQDEFSGQEMSEDGSEPGQEGEQPQETESVQNQDQENPENGEAQEPTADEGNQGE